eukprot:TRINITY_DN793_c0_g1_i13.p9 TRINITY_DN793_c0_g1~~TRINITY_DN793_c0_g1_i13.p9  ORF type:complete len:116 (+),score=1.51 TRINITY_DN793_c0_g1_i13:1662-2009(+)
MLVVVEKIDLNKCKTNQLHFVVVLKTSTVLQKIWYVGLLQTQVLMQLEPPRELLNHQQLQLNCQLVLFGNNIAIQQQQDIINKTMHNSNIPNYNNETTKRAQQQKKYKYINLQII